MMHLDSMMETWEVQEAVKQKPKQTHEESGEKEVVNDAKLGSQLRMVQGEMRFPLHDRVRYFIELYTGEKREQTEALLGLGRAYGAQMDAALRQKRLPRQLRHLPAALSAYNPQATNANGGAGLWQLNYHTALRHGLSCNALVDERRDPIRSTLAALDYISDLQAQYRNWTQTIVAFTCGPANLQKARLRAGANANFSQLYPHLPESSRDYFPAFVAMSYVSQYYRLYGLDFLPVQMDHPSQTIALERPLSLSTVSKALKVPVTELRAFNPALRGDVLCVAGARGQLCLPSDKVGDFERRREQIFAMETVKKPVPPTEPEVAKVEVKEKPKPKPKPAGPPPNATKITYTIQPGDNLGAISRNHGVKMSDLQAWNNISGTLIKAGESLDIWVAKGRTVKKESTSKPKNPPKTTTKTNSKAKYKNYTVKSGDTLWGISQQFDGVTADDIMEANGITADIQPGLVIKIPIRQ